MENLVLLSFGNQGWGDELLAGLMITLLLAFLALPIGLLIGTSIAALSIGSSRAGRLFSVCYTTLIRGLPELLTLFIIYHGVGLLLNQAVKWWNPEVKYVEFSPFVAGVVALGLVFSSYAAEVIRGAWQAMDKGQKEAGIALAMNRRLIFWFVERPQIIRLALPGLGNLWINLLKDTALVSVIALDDLMRAANIAVGVTKKPFFFYLSVCLVYWLICILCERVLFKMETRLNRGLRSGR